MPLLGIGAVDLIAFVVALAVILAVGALYIFFIPITGLIRSVPLAGPRIADAINGGLRSAMVAVISTYDSLAHESAHFMWVLGVGIWHAVYNLVHSITMALGLANQAAQAAGAVAAQLPVDISGAISSGIDYADGVGATVLGEAQGLYNQSIAHADDLYNRVEGDLTNDFRSAVGTAEGLYNQSIAHADDLYNSAIGTAQQLATQAAQDGITEAQALYNQAIGALDSADAVINSGIDELTGRLDTVAGEIAGLATVGALAGILTQVEAITTEVDTCLEPLCDTVTPNAARLGNLGNLFKNLEALGIDAVLIALATEAVTNPSAVVDDVKTVVSDVGGPIVTATRDLIGV
jgi:hypothetical protein